MMKIVLLHDWLTGFRGGERVLEALCELFPNAPLYTLIYKKGSVGSVIEDRAITASFLNHIPRIHLLYRQFLPLFPKAVEALHISHRADLVISSSHCVIKGVKKPRGSKHLCYIHSPMRYLYDQYDVYFGHKTPLYQKLGMKIFRKYLVSWDLASNKNVDRFVANSQFVKERIQRYYNLESDVIYPFVHLDDFREARRVGFVKEDFYLMVSAFAPNKRVDLAIKAFNKNGKKLKIIGSGQQENTLKRIAKNNITFLGNVPRQDVLSHLFRAKGFILPGVEDFGITPLEAMAAATPVIAYAKGGLTETLDETVCEFFHEASPEALTESIVKFEKKQFPTKLLIERADRFSKEKFKERFRRKVEDILA